MGQPQTLDIVAFCALVASLIFSPQVAAVVGPYVAIMIAAAVGASFALGKRDKTSRSSAVLFFARIMALACLISGGLAALLHAFYPTLPEATMLVPIAVIVGYIGDGWGEVMGKLKSLFFAVLDTLRPGAKP